MEEGLCRGFLGCLPFGLSQGKCSRSSEGLESYSCCFTQLLASEAYDDLLLILSQRDKTLLILRHQGLL